MPRSRMLSRPFFGAQIRRAIPLHKDAKYSYIRLIDVIKKLERIARKPSLNKFIDQKLNPLETIFKAND